MYKVRVGRKKKIEDQALLLFVLVYFYYFPFIKALPVCRVNLPPLEAKFKRQLPCFNRQIC
jgi:hypothetical protein